MEPLLKDHSVLLFPHWNDVFPEARLDGLFNAGMVGVAPGAESFLNWWSQLCYWECTLNEGGGVVGDQAYLDFVPVCPGYFYKLPLIVTGISNRIFTQTGFSNNILLP